MITKAKQAVSKIRIKKLVPSPRSTIMKHLVPRSVSSSQVAYCQSSCCMSLNWGSSCFWYSKDSCKRRLERPGGLEAWLNNEGSRRLLRVGIYVKMQEEAIERLFFSYHIRQATRWGRDKVWGRHVSKQRSDVISISILRHSLSLLSEEWIQRDRNWDQRRLPSRYHNWVIISENSWL